MAEKLVSKGMLDYYTELLLKRFTNYGEFEQLKAQVAEIVNAYITVARVDQLLASYATISELDAGYAKIDLANINNATIKQLFGEEAKFDDLVASLARIGTLLVGNSKVDQADIIHLTAENAEIESLLANNILAKALQADTGLVSKIYTNRINIQSGDGNSYWVDNLIAMNDAEGNPRMLIGKVEDEDYNVLIYNPKGEELFNATGVTYTGLENRIAEVLNSEIDPAKIMVHRLDIEGITNVFNSMGQVYFDEEQLKPVTFEAGTLTQPGAPVYERLYYGIKSAAIFMDDNMNLQAKFQAFGDLVDDIDNYIGGHEGESLQAKWQNDITLSEQGLQETISSVETSANGYTDTKFAQFQTSSDGITAKINKIAGFDADGELVSIGQNFTMTAEGLRISSDVNNTDTYLLLKNDRMSFIQGGVEVAYISEGNFAINEGWLYDNLQIGDFRFVPLKTGDHAGSLGFKHIKIGG